MLIVSDQLLPVRWLQWAVDPRFDRIPVHSESGTLFRAAAL